MAGWGVSFLLRARHSLEVALPLKGALQNQPCLVTSVCSPLERALLCLGSSDELACLWGSSTELTLSLCCVQLDEARHIPFLFGRLFQARLLVGLN